MMPRLPLRMLRSIAPRQNFVATWLVMCAPPFFPFFLPPLMGVRCPRHWQWAFIASGSRSVAWGVGFHYKYSPPPRLTWVLIFASLSSVFHFPLLFSVIVFWPLACLPPWSLRELIEMTSHSFFSSKFICLLCGGLFGRCRGGGSEALVVGRPLGSLKWKS
ncbi:hypothetical protein BHE74_00022916 [Ensete ventricosum]|nr:hypothetical protein GW17_00040002 [Ensete ventricosum]RWW69476.1 hypothetical protein BHE74_00022916 [Ensete ventricosum]RZR98076.1 hypothetical protein BHM03_00027380 [Ensete ventricosum]